MGKQQRSGGDEPKCASTAEGKQTWGGIDFSKCERKVKKLQNRIAKAQREGKYNKVRALQHLLVTSFEAKALAVKRVTSNKGKHTAGVDGVIWDTNAKKCEAISSLKRRGYKTKPLKRVYIPKKNGKKRPLGIPTMRDRAMQALYLMALLPITETTADRNSYGFRPYRSTADAMDAIHRQLSKEYSPEWVLEGDIKGCFDHISHEWLLHNVQVDRAILDKWLKSGVVFNKLLTPTTEGTPQGGIISPTLANATLDGMERLVKSKYPTQRPKGWKGEWHSPKVMLVRYADDFIVTAASKEILEDIKGMLIDFLAERGLTLSEEKTLITHVNDGFDFLGFNVRKFPNGKLIIRASDNAQKRFTEKLHEAIFKKNKAVTQQKLIDTLNPILKGWGNYYCHVVSKKVFCKIDHILVNQLMRWGYRRHVNKSRRWTNHHYFINAEGRKWVFGFEYDLGGAKHTYKLMKLADMPIVRYIKVKSEANPFDPVWDEYFKKRKDRKSRERRKAA